MGLQTLAYTGHFRLQAKYPYDCILHFVQPWARSSADAIAAVFLPIDPNYIVRYVKLNFKHLSSRQFAGPGKILAAASCRLSKLKALVRFQSLLDKVWHTV